MPRIRNLKPGFFKDEDVKDLPPRVQIFYLGLWCQADREGRLEDRPERLKVEIFPYSRFDTEKGLELLARPKRVSGKPYIVRYRANGRGYVQILEWHHQKPHHKEARSVIEPPPKDLLKKALNGEISRKARLENGVSTVQTPGKSGKEGVKVHGEGEGEGKGDREGEGDYIAKVKSFFENITEEHRKYLDEQYPNLNIGSELARMKRTLINSTHKRKSRFKSYIINWLNGEQRKLEYAKKKPSEYL